MSKKYPEQRSAQHAGSASAQPSGDEVYTSTRGGAPAARQTPSFHGPQHGGSEGGATSSSTRGVGGTMWALVFGVFALSSVVGYLLWRD